MKGKEQEIVAKNSLYTDYRAEFLAAFLIDNGINENEVRIIRNGVAKAGKSVEKIGWEYSQDKFSKFLSIYTRKRNLYESLPEGLFHRPLSLDDKKDKHAVIESFKYARQVALSASFFFRDLEMSIDRMLVLANLYELQLDKRNEHPTFIQLLTPYWSILRNLPLDKALLVISFFSQAYRLKHPDEIAEVLSELLECDVTIKLEDKYFTFPSDYQWKLGDCQLGLGSIFGGSVNDCYPLMTVDIKNLSRSQSKLLYKDSEAYSQLTQILDMFIPADAELKINISITKKEAGFSLTDDHENSPILGFTTILS